MSVDSSATRDRDEAEGRRWAWARMCLGLVAFALGVAAIVWPEATVRVVGFLFGLNLLVSGASRAVLTFFIPDYPVFYRILAVVFGVFTAVIGLLCLRNVLGSAILLALVVAVGWIFHGVLDLVLAFGSRGEPGTGWRVGAGIGQVLAGLVVFMLPEVSLATFVAVGAVVLILTGVGQLVSAVVALRVPDGRTPAVPAGP